MDHTAIQEIIAQSVLRHESVIDATRQRSLIGLPKGAAIHDLEKYDAHRRSFRAGFTTSEPDAFRAYLGKQTDDAPIYIDPPSMKARTIFDIGSTHAPGHGHHTASLALQKTPEYSAWLSMVEGSGKPQREFAEWIEDWRTNIVGVAFDEFLEPVVMPPAKLVAAVRKVSVDAKAKVDHSEVGHRTSKSALASIEVASTEGPLPEFIRFTCKPYVHLPERQLLARLSVRTGDTPSFRVIWSRKDSDLAEMADDFATLMNGLGISREILIGSLVMGN